MKIDIPYEIGDPVIILDFNQHDGWDICYTGFKYTHIPLIEKNEVFRTYAEAKVEIDKRNKPTKRTDDNTPTYTHRGAQTPTYTAPPMPTTAPVKPPTEDGRFCKSWSEDRPW